MNEKIELITKENENMLKNKQELRNKLNKDEQKINSILNLLLELKGSFPQNNNNINKPSDNIINNTNNNINKNSNK